MKCSVGENVSGISLSIYHLTWRKKRIVSFVALFLLTLIQLYERYRSLIPCLEKCFFFQDLFFPSQSQPDRPFYWCRASKSVDRRALRNSITPIHIFGDSEKVGRVAANINNPVCRLSWTLSETIFKPYVSLFTPNCLETSFFIPAIFALRLTLEIDFFYYDAGS